MQTTYSEMFSPWPVLSTLTFNMRCHVTLSTMKGSKAKELLIRCLSIRATLPLHLPFPSQALDKAALLIALIIKANIQGR